MTTTLKSVQNIESNLERAASKGRIVLHLCHQFKSLLLHIGMCLFVTMNWNVCAVTTDGACGFNFFDYNDSKMKATASELVGKM